MGLYEDLKPGVRLHFTGESRPGFDPIPAQNGTLIKVERPPRHIEQCYFITLDDGTEISVVWHVYNFWGENPRFTIIEGR